jgi:hypothetical protein
MLTKDSNIKQQIICLEMQLYTAITRWAVFIKTNQCLIKKLSNLVSANKAKADTKEKMRRAEIPILRFMLVQQFTHQLIVIR